MVLTELQNKIGKGTHLEDTSKEIIVKLDQQFLELI